MAEEETLHTETPKEKNAGAGTWPLGPDMDVVLVDASRPEDGGARGEDPDLEKVEGSVSISTDWLIEKLEIISKKKDEVSGDVVKDAKKEIKEEFPFIDVDKYLFDFEKIRGKDKEEKDKNKRREVGKRKQAIRDLVIDLKEGVVDDEGEQVLNKMGIDLVDLDKRIEKKEFDEDEEGDVPEAPVVENVRKETAGDFVRENEVALNKFLLQDWNPILSLHTDKPKLVKLVELSKSIHKERLMERFRGGDTGVYEEMFLVAQDVYLKEVLNDGNFIKIAGNAESIKRQEQLSGVINTEVRNKFEGKLIEFVAKIFHDEKRRWFEYGVEGEMMKENLEKFLINKFNKSEIVEDKSDYGVVVKTLKEPYLGTDNIGLNINFKIDKEPKADLIRQMIKIHDITVMMDNPTYKPENARPELLQSVDEALVAMLSLKKGGILVVPKMVEVYDTVMREQYRISGREIDIDNGDLHGEVFRRVRRSFGSDEEANLFIKMGRDVCRITGVDAQYGYPARVEPEVSSGLALTVRGSFLRGLFNYKKALVTYGTDVRLTGGINLGIIPFWNKLRGDEIVGGRKAKELLESAPISAGVIERLIQDKMVGSENYLGWFGTLKGYAEAKKAEGEFMATPTLDNFVTKVVPAYWGYMQYTPEVAQQYFLRRLTSCIPFFIDKGEKKERLRASLIKLFMPDGYFDGKGVFSDPREMKKYFTDFGVNVDISPLVVKTRRDSAYEMGRNFTISGILDKLRRR